MTLTAKQEAFCQAIVKGKDQSDAYRIAYDARNMKPATIASKASILMTNGNIRARIEAIRAPVVQELRYGLMEAMLEAAEAFNVARDKEQGGAMVAAVQLRAKLNGLLVEKREDVTDPLKKAMGNMSPERAEELMNALDQVQAVRNKAKT